MEKLCVWLQRLWEIWTKGQVVFIVNIRKLCRTVHFAQLHGICTKALPHSLQDVLSTQWGLLVWKPCEQKGIGMQIWRNKNIGRRAQCESVLKVSPKLGGKPTIARQTGHTSSKKNDKCVCTQTCTYVYVCIYIWTKSIPFCIQGTWNNSFVALQPIHF